MIAQLCRDPKTLLDKVESVCRIHKPENRNQPSPRLMEPLTLSVFFYLAAAAAWRVSAFGGSLFAVLHWCDTLSGAGQTNPAVASQGHGVGVRRVDLGQTVGKSHGDEARQVVGADPLVGLNERGLQDGPLQTEKSVKTLAQSDESWLRRDKKLATLGTFHSVGVIAVLRAWFHPFSTPALSGTQGCRMLSYKEHLFIYLFIYIVRLFFSLFPEIFPSTL